VWNEKVIIRLGIFRCMSLKDLMTASSLFYCCLTSANYFTVSIFSSHWGAQTPLHGKAVVLGKDMSLLKYKSHVAVRLERL
jgi:hypothetical protein